MKKTLNSLIESLIQHNLTLTSCESLTGGLFASQLTKIPGAGKVFKGSLVVYSNEAKIKLAKVSPLTLEKFGAVSSECAEEMAKNTQQLLKVDIAISFTGNAGPSASEGKPVGLVYIGLAFKGKLISKKYQLTGSREEIRERVVEEGIKLVKERLKSEF